MSYRWNISAFAAGYDVAAALIHPHYTKVQDQLLEMLASRLEQGGWVADLGGGSGRLGEKILERFPLAKMIVVDQSEPFLAIAERRMTRFQGRGRCVQARLQDDWRTAFPEPPIALVSTSAIHHLEPAEKQSVYQRCFDALAPGGMLLNGDEVRPEDDTAYRNLVERWAAHMNRLIEDRRIPEAMNDVLRQWITRNVERFGEPRKSGDDCHETLATQLDYLRQCGFQEVGCPWQQELWAILAATKGQA